jgi:hypothetical protein
MHLTTDLERAAPPTLPHVYAITRFPLYFSIFGLILADLIAIPPDNTPSVGFPRGFFDLQVQFPQSPSHVHTETVSADSVRYWSLLHPHHFFSIHHRISCRQLCGSADGRDSANNFTAQEPQPIVISILFYPCSTQSPAAISLPCHDIEPEAVASAQLVLGISSDMMSLANLTLEHIIGKQNLTKTSSSSASNDLLVESTVNGDNNAAGGSSSSSTFGSPQPASSLPRSPRLAFTSHRCTQLQHVHSSGSSPLLPPIHIDN